MHGDFSRWDPVRGRNLGGVLHQQGRVLLDRDWNDQARLAAEWRDTAARDTIGAGVAAVPAHTPTAFQVTRVHVNGTRVEVEVLPGHAWADGIPVTLAGTPGTPVHLTADYLDASVQAAPGSVTGGTAPIAFGVRDVVVLETWRETLSAFQLPAELLEPALGGPDTTARALVAFRLRLARLGTDETCRTVQLADRARGTLRATLPAATPGSGDCPVPDEGGYTGFEHQLYRVEIADVDAGAPAAFKWSRGNGGLVGRGTWVPGTGVPGTGGHFTLAANHVAIRTSGRSTFYLEVVEYEPTLGIWHVTYGAEVALAGDQLNVATRRFSAPRPAGAGPDVFYRLWDGFLLLSGFATPVAPADPAELEEGIRLELPGAASAYRPGDYWTFSVRAGLANPTTLVDGPPQGVRYHRVALAELTWNTVRDVAGTPIEDCRRLFRPLTDQDCCCTFTVGDGVESFGDFNSVEQAVQQLPEAGGKVCLLPGVHRASVEIGGLHDVEIAGCGARSLVVPRVASTPLFTIHGSRQVWIHGLTMATGGTAVQVKDGPSSADPLPSSGIRVEHNGIVAGVHAVEVRPRNTERGENDVVVAWNQVGMVDRAEGLAAILVSADGVLVERNRLVVVPAPDPDDPDDPRPPDTPGGSWDPCAPDGQVYAHAHGAWRYAEHTLYYVARVSRGIRKRYGALGGIQVAGGSERVRIAENVVIGGRGHGITLGELPAGQVTAPSTGTGAAGPLPEFFVTGTDAARVSPESFASTVYDLEIEGNVIQGMGMCGIGVVAFFDLARAGLMVRAEGLYVARNRVEDCVRAPVAIPPSLRWTAALGGIALADCARAAFRGNRVEGNGTRTGQPVCGIFTLAGDEVEFAENVVAGNGPAAGVDNETRAPGHRGGIVVGFAMARLSQALLASGDGPPRDGLPAVRVLGNVVSQPAGQALMVGAIGPVLVEGNTLATVDADATAAPLTLLAATVLVLDLAVSKDALLPASFSQLGSGGGEPSARAAMAAVQRIPSGGVLFAGNQVTLDQRGAAVSGAFSSVLIASLDDVCFADSQCECTSLLAVEKQRVTYDVVLADTLLAGISVRATGNRFQEGFTLAFWSMVSLAGLNTAAMNQSTHCLWLSAWPQRLVDFGNQVWYGNAVLPGGWRGCRANQTDATLTDQTATTTAGQGKP